MKKNSLKYLFIYIIRFYRFFISPLFPASCRFYPTCSSFALQSIKKRGVLSGSWLAIKRLSRCHPLSGQSGHDPLL